MWNYCLHMPHIKFIIKSIEDSDITWIYIAHPVIQTFSCFLYCSSVFFLLIRMRSLRNIWLVLVWILFGYYFLRFHCYLLFDWLRYISPVFCIDFIYFPCWYVHYKLFARGWTQSCWGVLVVFFLLIILTEVFLYPWILISYGDNYWLNQGHVCLENIFIAALNYFSTYLTIHIQNIIGGGWYHLLLSMLFLISCRVLCISLTPILVNWRHFFNECFHESEFSCILKLLFAYLFWTHLNKCLIQT